MSENKQRIGLEVEARYKLKGLELDRHEPIAEATGHTSGLYVGSFTGNGGRVYCDNKAVEVCTPELTSLAEVVTYRDAMWQLLTDGLIKAVSSPRSGKSRAVQLYHRVVDTKNNTWGVHDNFELDPGVRDEIYWTAFAGHQPTMDLLKTFTATRVPYAGAGKFAGDAGEGDWRFSQKRMQPFTGLKNRSYASTLFTIDINNNRGTAARFESRDNDNPHSGLQVRLRLAAMAGFLAITSGKDEAARTTLFESSEYAALKEYGLPGPENPLNAFRVDGQGMVQVSELVLTGLSFQRRCLEVMHSDKVRFGDVPIAEMYPQELTKLDAQMAKLEIVLRQQEPVDYLAQDFDWAAKVKLARQVAERNTAAGNNYRPDEVARVTDLRFDSTDISVSPDGEVAIKHSLGQRLREQGKLGGNFSPDEVKRAMTMPPEGSASTRVGLLRKYQQDVTGATWAKVYLRDGNVIDIKAA